MSFIIEKNYFNLNDWINILLLSLLTLSILVSVRKIFRLKWLLNFELLIIIELIIVFIFCLHSFIDNNSKSEGIIYEKVVVVFSEPNEYSSKIMEVHEGLKVKILNSHNGVTDDELNNFKKGDILVTDITDPDWEPVMKIASAIITNKGGRVCHAAIVARELGIPAIVGSINCTEKLKDGDEVTVSCAEGDVGYVYQGKIPFTIKKTDVNKLPKIKTDIMFNIGSPENAFKLSMLPNKGVGLAREEFIINNFLSIIIRRQ